METNSIKCRSELLGALIGSVRAKTGRGGFLRNLLTLLSGTAVAQAIVVGVSPVLTRMYSPEDFGVYALVLAIVTTCVVFATGRLEWAIMLPREKQAAVVVAAAASVLAVAISAVLLVLFLAQGHTLVRLLGNSLLGHWTVWIPVMVLVSAMAAILGAWSNREKEFRLLAANAVTRTGSTAGGQLALGSLGNPGGLIWGAILGQGLAAIVLGGHFCQTAFVELRRVTQRDMLRTLLRYRRFPIFDVPSALCSSAAIQMPVFLLSIFFGGAVVGLFALTQRILVMPVSLLANSVVGVFRQRATEDFKRFGSCRPIFLKCLALLSAMALPPFLLLFLFGPALFATVFGPDWREAGEYTRILSVMFFFRFIAAPLSFVILLRERQSLNMWWQVGVLTGATTALLIGGYTGNPRTALTLFGGFYAVSYIGYLVLSYRLTQSAGFREADGI